MSTYKKKKWGQTSSKILDNKINHSNALHTYRGIAVISEIEGDYLKRRVLLKCANYGEHLFISKKCLQNPNRL